MKVYYCNTYENGNTNFGDVLTPFILEKLGIDSVFCNKMTTLTSLVLEVY